MAEGDGIGPMARQPIRGGSLSEVDLPVAAWPAVRERSQSPMAQGLRRLRRNRTALVGAAIALRVISPPPAGIRGTMRVTAATAIVRIPIYARLVRGSVLSIKEKEYIEACRALGVRDPSTLLRHVLPNCLAPIIVTTTLGIATSIIVEATLSFLGLGTQPPTPSWGWDLKANVAFIQANSWLSLFPGIAIFVTVLGFNLFGDGLRDALDPRLK